MNLRPEDRQGDLLPVPSVSSLLSGPEAVALLVKNRLSLWAGEWWENPDLGFPALEWIREGRLPEADLSSLSSVISAYVRETPGVLDVEEVCCGLEGRKLSWSCTVRTRDGTAAISVEQAF